MLGSLEAIIGELEKLQFEYVGVKIIGKGLGYITEDDVHKAEATPDARLVGFHVKPSPSAEEILKEKNVPFSQFKIIYDLTDWVRQEMEKLLEYEIITTELGTLKVKAIFRTEKNAMIVGGVVTGGKIKKDSLIRVMRAGEEVGRGKLVSCQIGQQNEKQVPEGSECGISFEGKTRIYVDDELEVYIEEKKIRTLE